MILLYLYEISPSQFFTAWGSREGRGYGHGVWQAYGHESPHVLKAHGKGNGFVL